MAKMEQQVENIDKGVERIEDALKEHIKWEDHKYEEMDKRFSGKWVEKVLVGVLILLLGGILVIANGGV